MISAGLEIVEKSGSWYSYDSQRIGQGREQAKIFLKENPDIAKAIEQKILANAGVLSEALQGNPESDTAHDELMADD